MQLSKAYFPSFLDYEWRTAGDGTPEPPKPIALDVTGLKAYLSPHGATPADDADILLNGKQSEVDFDLGITAFDLTDAPGSPTSMVNNATVDCVLTAGRPLRGRSCGGAGWLHCARGGWNAPSAGAGMLLGPRGRLFARGTRLRDHGGPLGPAPAGPVRRMVYLLRAGGGDRHRPHRPPCSAPHARRPGRPSPLPFAGRSRFSSR